MADTASTNPVADGWQTVGDKTTSKLLEEGALQDEWTMYFERKDQEKNGLSEVDYMNSLLNVGTFKSFKGFLTRWEAVTKSEAPGNIHLFKKGVRPIWEDEHNINGGKWVASILKDQQEDEHHAFKPWLDLVVAVLSGHLGYTDQICGVVLSLKQWGTSLHIWNRDADDAEQQEQVKQKVTKLLKTKKVKYVRHRTSLQKNIEVMFPHHNDGEKKPKDKWGDLPDRRGPSPSARHVSPAPRHISPMPRHVSPFHKFGHPDTRVSPSDRRISPTHHRSDVEQDWNAIKEQHQEAEAHKMEPAPPPAKNPWTNYSKAPVVEVTPAPEVHKAEPALPPAKNPWTKAPVAEVTPVTETPKAEPSPPPTKSPWNMTTIAEEAPQPVKVSEPAPPPAKNPWNVGPKPTMVPIGVDPEPEHIPVAKPEKAGKTKAPKPAPAEPVHHESAWNKQPKVVVEHEATEDKKTITRPRGNSNAHSTAAPVVVHEPKETKKAVTRPRGNSDAFVEAEKGQSISQSSKMTRRGETPQAPPVWDGKRLIAQASVAPTQPEKPKEQPAPQPKAKAPKPTPVAAVPRVAEPEPEAEPHKPEHPDEWHIVKEVKKVRARSSTLDGPSIPAVEALQKAEKRASSAQHTRSQSPAVVTVPSDSVDTTPTTTTSEDTPVVEPAAPTPEAPIAQQEQPQQSTTVVEQQQQVAPAPVKKQQQQPKQQSQPQQPKKKQEVHKNNKSSKPTSSSSSNKHQPQQHQQLEEIKPLPIQQIAIAGGLVLVSIVSYYLLM